MNQILSTVSELLLKAIPTIVLVVILYFFLRSMLFEPLSKVLAQRNALTGGARGEAEQNLKLAEEKTSLIESKLRDARSAIYKEQEVTRRTWLDEQATHVKTARQKADEMVSSAKADLASETESAKQWLAAESSALADHIVKSLLEKQG
jgi:F-type H+-transporting ATPase subunit b